jgi:hypothetical protein
MAFYARLEWNSGRQSKAFSQMSVFDWLTALLLLVQLALGSIPDDKVNGYAVIYQAVELAWLNERLLPKNIRVLVQNNVCSQNAWSQSG